MNNPSQISAPAATAKPRDETARERFRTEWNANFAVNANAGSGKTTAISKRLAAMALSPEGAQILPKTAVVTFTKKAAQQIGQRAREVLLEELSRNRTSHAPGALAALNHLERAFFGTIHSFCLLLTKRYALNLGINQNPEVVSDENSENTCWQEFLEQDPMTFSWLPDDRVQAFLRHVPLDDIFELARSLSAEHITHFAARIPATLSTLPSGPSLVALTQIRDTKPKQARSLEKLRKNQATAEEWLRRFREGKTFLPFEKPDGSAGDIENLFDQFYAPLKRWLSDAGAVLAAELAERYRAWRAERGVQTYADQVETARSILDDETTLETIRRDGWRVILDEAQDTDPQQFAVLVEITRAPGARLRAWPRPENTPATTESDGPRPGHFCMVGDGQQAIYGSRADINNFNRHIDAFRHDDGGALLSFQVTFRTPRIPIDFFNNGFPHAFSTGNSFNYKIDHDTGEPTSTLKQVPYQPLLPAPDAGAGSVRRLPLAIDDTGRSIDQWMAEEARQLAAHFKAHGPAGVGANKWSDVCMIAPRNSWLITVRKAFESTDIKTALQMRKNRNGDNPVYAWMTGLLAAVCDQDNAFEWFGVLREIFAVSDDVLARELCKPDTPGGASGWNWADPSQHTDTTLRAALETLRPFVQEANGGGKLLGDFAEELSRACHLAEKAHRLDTSGALEAELDRLLAEAAKLSLGGASTRDWMNALRNGLDNGRPAGKPEDNAINLLTSHSAKGLEWPVIIPLGLWRKIGKKPENGLRLIGDNIETGATASGQDGDLRVYFDTASIDPTLLLSRNNEYKREQVRLLYVTLTRAKQHLIIPWHPTFGKKGVRANNTDVSFAEIWSQPEQFESLPETTFSTTAPAPASVVQTAEPACAQLAAAPSLTQHASPSTAASPLAATHSLPPLPRRLLPHQLAHTDATRLALDTRNADEPLASILHTPPDNDEAIDYGTWWHETMQNLPWTADNTALSAYFQNAITNAEKTLGTHAVTRAREELARLLDSDALRKLRDSRWIRETELPVFSPVDKTAWIDGVMDLTLHDPAASELRVVDWKTNRRRPGEADDKLLSRLAAEYAPQLRAYGQCAQVFFPNATVRLFVISSAAGKAVEIGA